MSPGGHLVTTAAACAVSAAAGMPWPVTLGVAAGGFLIDLDHAFDYVVFDRQRDLRPGAFLRYYLEGRVRRTVLVLHSYELLAVLGVLAWITGWPALAGYLIGALGHLALDLAFNGDATPYSIAAFYSFGYRLAHRFEAAALLGHAPRAAPPAFWTAFFKGAAPAEAAPPAADLPRARLRAR